MIFYRTADMAVIGAAQREIALQVPRNMRDSAAADQAKTEHCRFYIQPLKALGIFSLDTGAHASGWWKNPYYDTCWHLSISFQDIESGDKAPQDHNTAWKIVRGFFQAHARLVWSEPPRSKDGHAVDVWHYRLFVDRATGLPILPRGEVYTKTFTGAGWKSYSDVQAMIQQQEKKAAAMAAAESEKLV